MTKGSQNKNSRQEPEGKNRYRGHGCCLLVPSKTTLSRGGPAHSGRGLSKSRNTGLPTGHLTEAFSQLWFFFLEDSSLCQVHTHIQTHINQDTVCIDLDRLVTSEHWRSANLCLFRAGVTDANSLYFVSYMGFVAPHSDPHTCTASH